ncbi:MAG: hypothetical protein EPN20_07930 [Magnetospirillum sp.]|nr:MAG: hypothetical protein EPN20_07930 [Magnetospirillum sp.]
MIAAVALVAPITVAAETCGYPLPAANTSVAAYVKTLQGFPKGGLAQELGEGLNDLVEWTPTSCGDVSPEVTYKIFVIARVATDPGNCRAFRMGIVPPGPQPDGEETPVSCSPAKDGSVNGWICFFRK